MVGFYELVEKALALEKQGRKIVRLNIGDTGLPVPQCAIDAAAKALQASKGYGSSAGTTEILDMLAEREGCERKNIVIGPGSKHLLFALLSTLCKRGERVAFPTPYWPAYRLASEQLGLKICQMQSSLETGWQFGEAPEAELTLICNPLNPTSTVYDASLVQKTIKAAHDSGKHIVVDEAYKGIAFTEIPKFDAIRVRSFSKEFNMENWRLGYLVAPDEIAQKVIKFNQVTATCVPKFVQHAGMACIENEKEILSRNRAFWKGRMGVADRAMRNAGFRFASPQSGMYVFATHECIKDSGEFCLSLLDAGVGVAPGSEFGDFPSFIRLCANQPDDILEQAIAQMGEAVKG